MLAAERKVTSKLLEQDTSAEKLYILNEYVLSLVIGWFWNSSAHCFLLFSFFTAT